MGALIVVGCYALIVAAVFTLPQRLKRSLTPTPPPPAPAMYPPPVPRSTYIPQAEVNRRFAELTVDL